jgi:hypothetical protein
MSCLNNLGEHRLEPTSLISEYGSLALLSEPDGLSSAILQVRTDLKQYKDAIEKLAKAPSFPCTKPTLELHVRPYRAHQERAALPPRRDDHELHV